MNSKVTLIAEVKTESPFGWKSEETWDDLFKIAEKAGDIISIHTDARWGGSFELVKKARSFTKKPILAKGIHETDELVEKAVAAGADFVLVVGRIPKIHLEKCLVEPLDLEELSKMPKNLKAVWNSRDLRDGSIKKETFREARKIFTGWLCQASNIKSVDDIEKDADAVLVGSNLPKFLESCKG